MARTKKANEPKQETLEPQAHAEAHEAVNEPMLPAWEQKYQRPKPQAHTEKNWEQMTNAEREESGRQSDRNLVGKHAKAMKERGETPFYAKDLSAEEIAKTTPHNALTGEAYGGMLETKMRLHQEMNGFKEAKYVTLNQAHYAGMTLDPLKNDDGSVRTTDKGSTMYPIGVKFQYLQEFKMVPKKDKDGNEIPKLNKDGQPITYVDNKGETKIQYQMEKVKLEKPRIETTTLYNVEQLNRSNQKLAFKDLDLSAKQQYAKNLEAQNLTIQTDLSQFKLLPNTKRQLEAFMDASAMGRDYKVPQIERTNLNNTQSVVQNKQRERGLQF